jgi:solute carrier family 25 folate transporter 32
MTVKNAIIAGSLATIVCNPFDIIRINIQTKNISSIDTIKYIYNKRGILGFYKGIGIGILTIPTFWSIYFPCYENMKSIYSHSVSAYFSCCFASTITSPLWYIRQKYHTFTNFHTIEEIKNLRLQQFYSGLLSTYIINSNFIFQIPIYEHIKSRESFTNNPFNIFLATSFSKICASFVTFPLEDCRVLSRQYPKLSSLEIITKLHIERNYYKGLINYLVRSIPYHGVIFCTYEYLRQ